MRKRARRGQKKCSRVVFEFPENFYRRIEDNFVWQKIKNYSSKKILRLIFQFLKTGKYTFSLSGISDGAFGANFLEDHANCYPDEIVINSAKTHVDELPAVILHEILHSIFPQLREANILKLEYRAMKTISEKQSIFLVKSFFADVQNFKIKRRVESAVKDV